MTARYSPRWSWLFLLSLGLAAAPASTPAQEAADEQARQLATQRAAIEPIADSLLERLDLVDRLKKELASEKASALRGPAEEAQAALNLDAAKIALNEYESGTFPAEMQTMQGEIALAEAELARAKGRAEWAEKMFKKGTISEQETLSEKFTLQKAEFSLAQAKTKLHVLNAFGKDAKLIQLRAEIKSAEANLAAKKARPAGEQARVNRLERRIDEESITTREARVLSLLDEAIRLQGQGQLVPAQAKLDEVTRLWRIEEARRAQARFAETSRRIGEVAEAIRKAASPR